MPWVPVLIGCGIGIWFSLPVEPGIWAYGLVCGGLAVALVLRVSTAELVHAPAMGCACVLLGFLACGLRLAQVEAPVLEFRYYGPVTGRIIGIDRSSSDALRVTLDQVWLDRVSPPRMPEKVRVSLRGTGQGHPPFPGEIVMLTAHLGPPNGPAEPGAFDFRRMAYFERLGAVGYSQAPLMLWQQAAADARLIDRLRSHLSAAMRQAMPSQAGAFAAGAMTGDRSAIRADTVAALRDSALAHLLAISGMNLAFLISFVFAFIRYGLALVPPVALRLNSKKLAAVISLGVAGFYLALSGANVATERAFIMVSVMLVAVLLDRKALTLRSVAIAAVILLLWQPEAMLDPGFQMSFAATIALIAGFRGLSLRADRGQVPKWAVPVITLILSSVIGGFATAPYAAAHFNRFTDYGLLANLLTVPVMGAVVMPAGALAALLAPFGLAGLPLWAMEWGSAWILWVARLVAGWEGAVTPIPAPPMWVLGLVSFAGLMLILLRGRARLLSMPLALIALLTWVNAARPPLLVAEDGRLVGLLGAEGRALSAPRGAGFAAKSWLENDGDLSPQASAALRSGFTGPPEARQFTLAGMRGVILRGKVETAALSAHCAAVDLVILAMDASAITGGCEILDRRKLAALGAVAIYPNGVGLELVPVKAGRRIWSSPHWQDSYARLKLEVNPVLLPKPSAVMVTRSAAVHQTGPPRLSP